MGLNLRSGSEGVLFKGTNAGDTLIWNPTTQTWDIGPPSGGTEAPLSAELWCDAGTTVPTDEQNGSIAQPFATIPQAFAALVALALPAESLACVMLAAGSYDLGDTPAAIPPALALTIACAFEVAQVTGDWSFDDADAGHVAQVAFEGVIAPGALRATGAGTLGIGLLKGAALGSVDGTAWTGTMTIGIFDIATLNNPAGAALNAPTAAVTCWNGSTLASDGSTPSVCNSLFAMNCFIASTPLTTSSLRMVGTDWQGDVALVTCTNVETDALSASNFARNGNTYAAAPTFTLDGPFPTSTSVQTAAATATARVAGSLALNTAALANVPLKARFVATAPAATGESMTVDVRRLHADGTSVSLLTGLFTFNHTSVGLAFDLPLIANPSIPTGEGVEVIRTYTAGGTPTMTATNVTVASAN